ncbi:MAG: 50S rRNA methyltransferase [Candidatus Moraniibacteriota bacterium]|nr:MAG: 50S rRNA methyltransferase [Candidatus Moranbacteria bacterium]
MKIKIITIGKPKLSFVKSGFEEYIKRLRGYHRVEVVHLPDNVVEEKIVKLCDNDFVVMLDERGKEFSSKELAFFLNKKSVQGVGKIIFLIGGPDGHGDVVKSRADMLLSMSKLTFPHDIALLLISEALYRASTIIHNHPYHRD